MRQTIPFLLALAATPALAQETRQLEAHEHGVGALAIAVDGKDVLMAFHAPGADIVGFEYVATSAADIAAVEGALAVLARPSTLFVVPAAAECELMDASAELEGGDAHDGHEDHDDHAEEGHAEEGHAEEGHADEGHDHAEKDHDEHAHEEHDDDDHDDHGDEEHDDHAAKASHTEFHAEYRLTCADPSAIDRVTFAYFDAFENAREVEVQVVTAMGARAFEVTRDAPVLDLDGLF